MAVFDILEKLALGLIPEPDSTEAEIFRWRRRVAASIIILGVLTLLQPLLIFGFAPFLFPGFVSAADMRTIQDGQAAIVKSLDALHEEESGNARNTQIALLTGRIVMLRFNQCQQMKAGNRDAANAFGDDLSSALIAYRQLVGFDYPLRGCAEY